MFRGICAAICLVTFTLVLAEDSDELQELKKTVGMMGRQLMMQQFASEERLRMSGNSGLKQVRAFFTGSRPYFSPSHSGRSLSSIHNHDNLIRVVGLGEMNVVLNGVEFRTRHNDYSLVMPHRSMDGFKATEDVPFPEVPPEVTSKATVEEQIDEMKQWFKAFKEQNPSVRDYRKYFKPILCYMEGYWTKSNKKIDESFPSDRHFIDAKTWFELQEKVRFASASGRKDTDENFTFLPTTVLEVTNGTLPVYAQWNYRITCHPLKNDLPLNRLRVANELNSRMIRKFTMDMHSTTRAARFEVNPVDRNEWSDRSHKNIYLDQLMGEIPGLDNYAANLTDDSFGNLALEVGTNKPVNTGYYHRWFRSSKKDAMGETVNQRGFSDSAVYMAMTTQDKIASMKLDRCTKKNKKRRCIQTETLVQKWTYAIPLEIIYLTPLYQWNPYNIEYKGRSNSASGLTVNADGRDGTPEWKLALNGTNHRSYYRTPAAFFSSIKTDEGKADTSGGNKGVLDREGMMRIVRSSGTSITKDIPGVGTVRTRYPIMPIHGHGTPVWKELEALKDVTLNSQSFAHMFTEPLDKQCRKSMIFFTDQSRNSTVAEHVHSFELTPEEIAIMKNKMPVYKFTSSAEGHNHILGLRIRKAQANPETGVLYISECDGKKSCWDGHGRALIVKL